MQQRLTAPAKTSVQSALQYIAETSRTSSSRAFTSSLLSFDDMTQEHWLKPLYHTSLQCALQYIVEVRRASCSSAFTSSVLEAALPRYRIQSSLQCAL